LKRYLLDTNIAIFYMKGRFGLQQRFRNAGVENCFISEITLAELKFGVENSPTHARTKAILDKFSTHLICMLKKKHGFGKPERLLTTLIC
jgi:tRNA(fMet)-specific endonuclease VapC